MPGADDGLGKEAEELIKTWLNKPDEGYSFDRLYDQMTGYYKVSRNICDFIVFKSPYEYYIESKSTWKDRFDFSMITETQSDGLQDKNKIDNVYGLIIILFASYQRAFILNIDDIKSLIDKGIKSININKIDKWVIPYIEIDTIPNNRKKHLDYTGDLEYLVKELNRRREMNYEESD